MYPSLHPKPPARPEPAPLQYVALASLKGRGSAVKTPHRFESTEREQFDDGWGHLDQLASEQRLAPATQVIEERAKRILSGNQSPDISFDLSINPYRGCEHGCIYCFARPTHSYLNMSPGLDFETRIIAKVNAAERLLAAFASPSYEPLSLCLGTATDAYQPVERKLRITRSLIQVLHDCGHPFSLVTKSAGVERDLDLLAPMAERGLVAVYISVTTLDPALARVLEPRAASPQRRLRTIKTLADAGVPVGVSVSPIIPFLNEPELERILEAAAEAGARAAFSIPLRSPWEVNPLFQDWLQRHVPERAARIMARLRDMRGGRDNDARFGTRMTGEGVWAQLLAQRMQKACAKLGLNRQRLPLDLSQFRKPVLFDPAEGSAEPSLWSRGEDEAGEAASAAAGATARTTAPKTAPKTARATACATVNAAVPATDAAPIAPFAGPVPFAPSFAPARAKPAPLAQVAVHVAGAKAPTQTKLF